MEGGAFGAGAGYRKRDLTRSRFPDVVTVPHGSSDARAGQRVELA